MAYPSNKIKVAIVTNVIPNYREGFYDALFQSEKIELTVFCHKDIKLPGVLTIGDKYGSKVQLIGYKLLFKGAALWQNLPFSKLWREFDIVIFDGNPRHLSQALLSTAMAIFGKNPAIWSTVHSHRNQSFSEKMRLFWWRIFERFLLYMPGDIPLLKAKGLNDSHKKMASLNNGLNQRNIEAAISAWDKIRCEKWRSANSFEGKKLLLSCARVLPGRFDDMVLALVNPLLTNLNVVWVLIGAGPGLEDLKNSLQNAGVPECQYRLLGMIYDENVLVPYFLTAEVLVHTSAIGLSLFHALGYGLPVIAHNNRAEHGPEFMAFKEEKTGFLFKKSDPKDLAETINRFLSLSKNDKEAIKISAKNIPETLHNTDIMAANFEAAIVDFLYN